MSKSFDTRDSTDGAQARLREFLAEGTKAGSKSESSCQQYSPSSASVVSAQHIARPSGPVPHQTTPATASDIHEQYRTLVDKAFQKFARLRELPPYGRNRFDFQFHKAFQVYSRLWKFQQEHRSTLMDQGLTRWEIGEIASRIAQLYYNYYLRTCDTTFLNESFIFYEAIMTRDYFKDNGRDPALTNKQLRYYARFIVVCILLHRREMVRKLVRNMRALVDDYARVFQGAEGREWKLVVQEILRFTRSDSACDVGRPLRYSTLLDGAPPPTAPASLSPPTKPLRLQDAVLASYHYNGVKFSELTLDTFRMAQALEYEPSGAHLKVSYGCASGPSDEGAAVLDSTVPPNPHKYVLYRPSVPQLLLVLAMAVEELPPDSAVLVYLSASGVLPRGSSPLGPPFDGGQPSTSAGPTTNGAAPPVLDPIPERVGAEEQATVAAAARSRTTEAAMDERSRGTGGRERANQSRQESDAGGSSTESPAAKGKRGEAAGGAAGAGGGGRGGGGEGGGSASASSGVASGGSVRSAPGGLGKGLWLGTSREMGVGSGRELLVKPSARLPVDTFLYSSDLLPFTRRPLFIIIDSDASNSFETIHGQERGEVAVLLLSPIVQPSPPGDAVVPAVAGVSPLAMVPPSASSSLFTQFLAAPFVAFCRLTGLRVESVEADLHEKAECQLSSLLNAWSALLLDASDLSPAWARCLGDPFLRILILRFIFCWATFALHISYGDRDDYQPRCRPLLPSVVHPISDNVANGMYSFAELLGVGDQFVKVPQQEASASDEIVHHSTH